jgi:hypothetical protein
MLRRDCAAGLWLKYLNIQSSFDEDEKREQKRAVLPYRSPDNNFCHGEFHGISKQNKDCACKLQDL